MSWLFPQESKKVQKTVCKGGRRILALAHRRKDRHTPGDAIKPPGTRMSRTGCTAEALVLGRAQERGVSQLWEDPGLWPLNKHRQMMLSFPGKPQKTGTLLSVSQIRARRHKELCVPDTQQELGPDPAQGAEAKRCSFPTWLARSKVKRNS